MEVQLFNSQAKATDDVKNFSFVFFEGNTTVETQEFKNEDDKLPLFECVNDEKNTSVFINTQENMLNICVKADNSPYYTTFTFEEEDYFKFLYLMKLVIEKNK